MAYQAGQAVTSTACAGAEAAGAWGAPAGWACATRAPEKIAAAARAAAPLDRIAGAFISRLPRRQDGPMKRSRQWGGAATARIESDARRRLPLRGLAEDRKSTRLNSSHANISYAVFCLKKK